MSSNTSLRLAIVGLNHGARLAERFSKLTDARLVAVCAPDSPGNRAKASSLGVAHHSTVEQLIEVAKPDGVIVATPTDATYGIASICLQARIPILLEKPVACTSDAVSALEKCAERTGVPVLVGYHRRFSSHARRLRQAIDEGLVGNIRASTAVWAVKKPDRYFSIPWHSDPRRGGGALMINAVHEIDFFQWLLGPVEHTVTIPGFNQETVERTFAFVVKFTKGAIGSFLFSDELPSPYAYEHCANENAIFQHYNSNCYHFFGERGVLHFPGSFAYQIPDGEYVGWTGPALVLRDYKFIEGAGDPLLAELHHFCDVIRGNCAPLVTLRDAHTTLRVVETIAGSRAN